MLEDEGMVFTGLLVGLNVIDCNMCIKEEDLDQPVCTIRRMKLLCTGTCTSNSFRYKNCHVFSNKSSHYLKQKLIDINVRQVCCDTL